MHPAGRGNGSDEELTIRWPEAGQVFKRQVDVARDGQEATGYLFVMRGEAASPLPAVILLELKLPRVAVSRCERIRDTDRLPVVILTSSSEEGDLSNGDTSPGGNSRACKAFQFDELAAEVAQRGVYWLTIVSGAGGSVERLCVPFRRGR